MALCPMKFDDGAGNMLTGTNITGSVSVPSGTSTKVSEITLTPGTWLLVCNGNWSTNATGARQISIQNAINTGREASATTCGLANKEVNQQYFTIQPISSNTTIELYAYQNSGSNITIYPAMRATKISG